QLCDIPTRDGLTLFPSPITHLLIAGSALQISARGQNHMQIATWNINSLTVRLPQVLAWLAANPVDALGLQELKLTDDKFPHDAFKELGYEAVAYGQKTYNGVAILSRHPLRDVVRNIP